MSEEKHKLAALSSPWTLREVGARGGDRLRGTRSEAGSPHWPRTGNQQESWSVW